MIAESRRELDREINEEKYKGNRLFGYIDSSILKAYEEVVKDDPDTVYAESAEYRIAELIFNAGGYNQSVKYLNKFVTRYAGSYLEIEVMLALAYAKAMSGAWDEVKKLLESIKEKNPIAAQDDRVLILLGINSFKTQEYAKSIDYLREMKSTTQAKLYYWGKNLLATDKPLLAGQKFQKLLQDFPSGSLSEEALYLVAESFFVGHDFKASIINFEKFIGNHPKSPLRQGATFRIGLSKLLLEEYHEARSALQPLTEKNRRGEFAILSLYLIGESYMAEDKFKEASFAYGEVANTYSFHPYARYAMYKLAWCLYKQGNLKFASTTLLKLGQLYPESEVTPSAYFLLGNIYLEQKRYGDAARAYQKVIDTKITSELGEAALTMLNYVNLQNENYGTIVSGYQLLLNNYPPSPSTWRALTYLFTAEGYFRTQSYAEAKGLYNMIINNYQKSPTTLFAHDGLAWAMSRMGESSMAQRLRENLGNHRFASLYPDLIAENQFELGNILFSRKRYAQAISKFELFASENSTSTFASSALFRAGLCYYLLEYYGQAIETWERLEELYPESDEASKSSWRVADTYFRAQKYDKAITAYKKIIDSSYKEEDISLAYMRIAQSHYNANNGGLAIEGFKSLILAYPKSSHAKEAIELLSTLLEEPQHKSIVVATMEEIVSELGDSSSIAGEAQFHIALSAFDSKDFTKAVREFEKISGLYIETERLRGKEYYLGEAYYETSQFKQAARTYERLIANFPKDKKIPFALFRLGSAYFKLEEFANAARSFARLAQDHPSSQYAASALYNSALSFKKAKMWEKAEVQFLNYQRLYPDVSKDANVDEELVRAAEEQKDYKKAILILKTLRSGIPVNNDRYGEISSRMADNYILMGQENNAIVEYETMLKNMDKKNTWRMSACIQLGKIYEKNESWSNAIRVYEEIVNYSDKSEWIDAAKVKIEGIRSTEKN
ncbi:tetratricopeptide repeat protein [Elusimicrobiota bacterium]